MKVAAAGGGQWSGPPVPHDGARLLFSSLGCQATNTSHVSPAHQGHRPPPQTREPRPVEPRPPGEGRRPASANPHLLPCSPGPPLGGFSRWRPGQGRGSRGHHVLHTLLIGRAVLMPPPPGSHQKSPQGQGKESSSSCDPRVWTRCTPLGRHWLDSMPTAGCQDGGSLIQQAPGVVPLGGGQGQPGHHGAP